MTLLIITLSAFAQDAPKDADKTDEKTPDFMEGAEEEEEDIEIEGVDKKDLPTIEPDKEEEEQAPAEEPAAAPPPTGDLEAPQDANEISFKRVDLGEYNPETRMSISPMLGISVPIGHLGPGLAPRLEAGVVPAFSDMRFRFFGQIGAHGGSYTNSTKDPRVGKYNYRVKQRTFTFGAGAGFRVFGRRESVSPEIAVAPQLHVLDTQVNANNPGGNLGDAREAAVRLGWSGTVGFTIDAGKDQYALVRADVAGTKVGGIIIGDDLGLSVTPLVGYRMYR